MFFVTANFGTLSALTKIAIVVAFLFNEVIEND